MVLGCRGISKVWFGVGRFKFKVDWKPSQPKTFAQSIPLDAPSSLCFIPHLQTILSYSIWEKPNALLQVAILKQARIQAYSSKFDLHLISFHPFSGLKKRRKTIAFPSCPFISLLLVCQMQCRDLTNKSWPQLRSSACSTVFDLLIDLLKLKRAAYKLFCMDVCMVII